MQVSSTHSKQQQQNMGWKCFCVCVSGLYLKKQIKTCAPAPTNTHMHNLCFYFSGWQQKSSPLLPPLSPLSSSHYHIGQGLLIVPRQRAENGERKGIMTVRREKRGSGRKEGQTGYYEREGWEQWRHLESLFAFLSHGLRSQSDWSIRPAM